MTLFGIRLVGINAENGQKLLFTLALIILVLLLRGLLYLGARWLWRVDQRQRVYFWSRQSINLLTALLLLFGILSVWFNDPNRLAVALGLISAGLAFALQKVVTSIAGYFVILRGKTFRVGDRIRMGGVRGDVIALGFVQTTIMEMGVPPAMQDSEQSAWVRSRQYTGRIVTVTNDKIFDEPVYNYSRDLPYIWEEIRIPLTYRDNRERAEAILLDCAARHTLQIHQMNQAALEMMQRRYAIEITDLTPRVYYRLTDNWLELTLRFMTSTHGIRELKDAMSRDILKAFDEAGIGIASATYDIVGMPPLTLKTDARLAKTTKSD